MGVSNYDRVRQGKIFWLKLGGSFKLKISEVTIEISLTQHKNPILSKTNRMKTIVNFEMME